MKRFFATLDRAPLYWIAVGLGLVIFALNQQLPTEAWGQDTTEQGLLDDAFVEQLRDSDRHYEILPGSPQTFGSHVLPQFLTALVSHATGDIDRAGIWLSLAGILGVLTGMYVLAIHIYPHRGFAVACVLAAGALGPLHAAMSPYPSTALGMALIVWGMAFFLTALTEGKPHQIFTAGVYFGLAGYIRIELAMIWGVLAVYLIILSLFHAKARKREPSALAMALGGLFTVALVLWPLVHRNIGLAGTPLLPGHDAEFILGVPALAGTQIATPYVERLLEGLLQLTFGATGPGVFVGLLLPIGLVIGLIAGRHAKIPFFWIPMLVATVCGLAAVSWITGQESYLESLKIFSPVLLPFSFLPVAFVLVQILQHEARSPGVCRLIWSGAAVVFLVLVQIPHLFPGESSTEGADMQEALVAGFSQLPPDVRNANVISDRPGPLVQAGKLNVIGTRGQTDWRILAASTAYGGFRSDVLLDFLEENEVTLVHLSDPDSPLVDRLRLQADAPEITRVDGLPIPHRLFSISWP